MLPIKRRSIIMGLKSPDEVAYFAHRFPKSSTKFVIEKLKKMYTEETSPQVKAHDSELIREIVQ
jgi:lipopolysaccharide/colanic/teichoic acid biosynthesis glycosyltransferase